MFLKKTKKLFLFILIISEVFLLSIPSALALGSFKLPSFESIAGKAEKRYNASPQKMREMMQGMNVASLKSTSPELMIIFSPQNPKPGEEISAQALPMYFGNDPKNLYYTWYLRHNSEGGDDGKGNTDWNGGGVDIEDYKIEAMRILAQGGWELDLDSDGDGVDDYTTNSAWYSAQNDDDDDGYMAISGGDNKKGMDNYCYLQDYTGGKNYEISGNASDLSTEIYCENDALTPACGVDYASGNIADQPYRTCVEESEKSSSDDLYCATGNSTAKCHSGTPVCYRTKGGREADGIFDDTILLHSGESRDDDNLIITEKCASFQKPQCRNNTGNSGGSCKVNGTGSNARKHFFGRAPGYETGDNRFGKEEERFWGTNPHDPDTAGNGYSDEATLAGLDQAIFKWAYQEGDLVGVVIEGSSILATKHRDASEMIMWAFVNNHCSAKDFSKGSYTENIEGYDVVFDTIKGDLNRKCLRDHTSGDNLDAFMDPVGSAGENLDITLSYVPEYPINDPSDDRMGDIVSFQTIINNSTKEEQELLYNWEVDICSNGTFNCSSGRWRGLETYLMTPLDPTKPQDKLLKGAIKGNGLSELQFELGIDPDEIGVPGAFRDDVGYIRVKVKVREIFTSGISRQGIASAIMKVVSTDKKVFVYKVGNDRPAGDPNLQLIDSDTTDSDPLTRICSKNSEAVAGALIDDAIIESNVVCRVMKNEIIGMQVPNPDNNLSNFNWILDGKPLVCNHDMSDRCYDDAMTNVNFFPVTKNVGESYTLTVTATENVDLSDRPQDQPTSGKKVTLVKRFEVIEPYVQIISDGGDMSKDLGRYTDLKGDIYEDKSESVFEVDSGATIALKAQFHPSWINVVQAGTPPADVKEWFINGESQGQGMACADGNNNCLNFPAEAKPGEAYSINFSAAYNKDIGIRRALFDIWGVIQQESGDGQLSDKLMVEIKQPSLVTQSMPKKIFASLSSNLPGQVIFLLRIILTGFIIIFISGIIFSLTSPRRELGSRE